MLEEAVEWWLADEPEGRGEAEVVEGFDARVDVLTELEEPVAPALIEQTGHAPQPCLARTFSAIAICMDLLALAGLPAPP